MYYKIDHSIEKYYNIALICIKFDINHKSFDMSMIYIKINVLSVLAQQSKKVKVKILMWPLKIYIF